MPFAQPQREPLQGQLVWRRHLSLSLPAGMGLVLFYLQLSPLPVASFQIGASESGTIIAQSLWLVLGSGQEHAGTGGQQGGL